MTDTRIDGRSLTQLRSVSFTNGYITNRPNSCLVEFGTTKVLCVSSIDTYVPKFLKGKNHGWISAEYGMLPCSSETRVERDINKGKIPGRSHEIQRMIGRSLRTVSNLYIINGFNVKVDCDVIQADGGTRAAAVCGAYVSLKILENELIRTSIIQRSFLKDSVMAISCGILNKKALIDLNYLEDVNADVDADFVISGSGQLINISIKGEKDGFDSTVVSSMIDLAQKACVYITGLQNQCIK